MDNLILRSIHVCVTVTAKPKPVLPEKPVDRYPGPFGHWVQPVITVVWQLQDGKAMTGNALPVMVAQHMTSYRTFGRGRTQSYVTMCIIFRGFISGCTLISGSLFVAPATGALKYPTSQWVTVSPPRPWPGTSVVYKVNSLGFSLFPAVRQDQPVGVSLPEHNPPGTDRGVVIKCTRIPERMGTTLWVRRGKIHNLWVKQVEPARIRKGILLRTGAATSLEPDQ